MSTDIYAMPDMTKKLRRRNEERGQRGDTEDSGQLEVRGEREETVVDIYHNVDDFRSLDKDEDWTKKVRHRDGERGHRGDTEDSGHLEEIGEREERVVDIYESVADFRSHDVVPGPQDVMRENTAGRQSQGRHSKTVRRLFKVVGVCLGMLCLMLLGVIIVLAVHCNSGKLQNNYNNLQTKYENLTLGNQQLEMNYQQLQNNFSSLKSQSEIEVNNLRGEKAVIENTVQTTETRYSNLFLERDQLQGQVNQMKREQADKVCPSGWKKFGCSCYYRSTERKTWEKSRAECLKTRADLVVINSKEEQEFIRSLSGSGSSWIGLNRTQGNWMWVNGVPLTTWDWRSGYPSDNRNENCAEFWHGTGQGSTTNPGCSNLKACICEK